MHHDLLAGVAVKGLMPDPQAVNNTLHSTMTVRFDEPGSPLRIKALALTHRQTDKLLLAADVSGIRTPQARLLREESWPPVASYTAVWRRWSPRPQVRQPPPKRRGFPLPAGSVSKTAACWRA